MIKRVTGKTGSERLYKAVQGGLSTLSHVTSHAFNRYFFNNAKFHRTANRSIVRNNLLTT